MWWKIESFAYFWIISPQESKTKMIVLETCLNVSAAFFSVIISRLYFCFVRCFKLEPICLWGRKEVEWDTVSIRLQLCVENHWLICDTCMLLSPLLYIVTVLLSPIHNDRIAKNCLNEQIALGISSFFP